MTLEEQLKETITNIGKRFDEFKTECDKAYPSKEALTKGIKDAMTEMKLDKISQAIDDLTGKKEDLEKRIKLADEHNAELERKVNALRIAGTGKSDDHEQKALEAFTLQVKVNAKMRNQADPGEVTVEQLRAYKTAFAKYCRAADERMLSHEEFKALSVGIDPAGGYWVPADTGGRIVNRVFDLSPIRQISAVQPISTDRLEGVGDINDVTSGWVGEVQSRTETNTPDLTKYDIPVHEIYAMPKASQKILDDAAIDIEAWLMGKVTSRFARQEGNAFCVGNGINKPRGFTTYPTAATADDSRAWGTFEHVMSGASGAFAGSNPADVLFTLEGAFKPHFLNNASWVTRRQVITAVRKFKGSDNNYLWQPGLAAGKPATLIGYPIVMAEDMPALAADSLSMALGDFREGYQVVDRVGIRTLRDPYSAKPNVLFYSTMRVGAGAVNFEAIKFIKFNT